MAMKKLGASAWQYKKAGLLKSEGWEFAEKDTQLNLEYDQSSTKMIYLSGSFATLLMLPKFTRLLEIMPNWLVRASLDVSRTTRAVKGFFNHYRI
jgi:hypothetical protein